VLDRMPVAARYLAALLCGALLPLGLAPFDLWPLAILSSAALALLLVDLPPRAVFKHSFFYGVGLFAAGVSWVYVSIRVHGGESLPIALFLTSLFVALLALLFALPFALFGCLRRGGRTLQLLAFPVLWVLVEWLRGWIFTGFPWLYLGNAFVDTWLAGWAPIGGVLLLSLLGVFSGVALVLVGCAGAARHHRFIPVAVALALWVVAAPLQRVQWTTPVAQPLTLAMVQPALTPSQKWGPDTLYDILVQLREQSEPLWGVDLLIWPESAIPTPPQNIVPFMEFLEDTATHSGTTLITGIPLYEQGRYYNSVILVGEDAGSYAKRHLVPFGEYLPLDSLLRGIIQFFDRPMSSFSHGPDEQPLLNVKGTPTAAAICYEIVYQDLVAGSSADAGMILTLSNDVWFGDTIAPHQHLQMARLRAIENAKPVIRGTNDGISAIIGPKGEIEMTMPQFTAAAMKGTVTAHEGHTPFNHFGSRPVVIFCLLIFALALASTQRRKA